jgi:aminoglycoside/choline kinase family phosphotransferase
LEADFQALAQRLEAEGADFLLFRDFQARNILLREERIYFIDYQSARRGYLAYDVASLLFQAKAQLSEQERAELLEGYIQAVLALWPGFDAAHFRRVFHHWVLLRLLQVLGAYGYKGWVERKAHFLESIGPAQQHLRYLLGADLLPEGLPELRACLVWLAEADLVKLKD